MAIKRLTLALLLQISVLYAGHTDIVSYASPLLGITVSYVVILPDSYSQETAQGKRFPVLYLLHCAGCDLLTWTAAGTGNMTTLIDSVHFIAVAPYDNDLRGWWLDSPKIPNYAFSRFLVEEIKPRVDSQYATIPGRSSTGVAGWSMGGFGALHNAIAHPDVFGAAFSIKGGLDVTLPINPHWGSDFGLYSDLGNSPADTVNYNAVNILLNIHRLKTDSVHLGSYGGLNDAFFGIEDLRLDTIMTGLAMPHLFFEADEDHFSVPDSSMLRVLHFFDSVFVQSPASVRPRAGPAAQTLRRAIPAVWYDIRGRRLTASSAIDKRYLQKNGSGVGIAVMSDGVRHVLFYAVPCRY